MVKLKQVLIDSKWPAGIFSKNKWGKKGERWFANLQVLIADQSGKEVGDYYGLLVASPEFLHKPTDNVKLDEKYVFELDEYDQKLIDMEVEKRISKINASGWEQLRSQMSEFFWLD